MRRLDPLLVLLAVLGAWQAGHWAAGDVALASPSATLARLGVLAGRPGFWVDVGSTAGAFAVSAVISVAAGVLLGCALGLSRLLGRVIEPVLTSLYALPKVTLYPVVLLLFGLGASAKIAFGVMHGLIPIVLVTMNAVLQVRPVHLRAARAMRLTRGQLLRRVVLPAITPDLLAGIRIGGSACVAGRADRRDVRGPTRPRVRGDAGDGDQRHRDPAGRGGGAECGGAGGECGAGSAGR